MMKPQFDICIRGAGMVGKTLALLLARERLRVALVRSPDDAQSEGAKVDIRSYALNAASRQILQSLKVWPQHTQDACAIAHMRVQEAQGAQVAFDASAGESLGHIVDAAVLDTQLEAALRYQSGITLVEDSVPAHLLAVCEGRDSASRAELDLAYEASPYGQTAIASHLACSVSHQNTAYQWFDEQGNILALLPRAQSVDGAACTVALVWSLAESQAREKLALTDEAFCAALQTACNAQLGDMRLLAPRAAWPLKLAQAAHWCGQTHGKSWVLLGDAAHSMHPLAGQGLNVGLADAVVLAQTLAARPAFRSVGDLRLLRDWERARRADWQRMRLATDGIQRLFTHNANAAQLLRHWGMRAFDALPPLKSLAIRAARGQALAGAHALTHDAASRPGA